MDNDLNRVLKVKTLEISKLRQRIKELEEEANLVHSKHAEELSKLVYENEDFKKSLFELEEKNGVFQLSAENLHQSLAETNMKYETVQQREGEMRSKLRQLQENNRKLVEELVEAGKSRCKAEEEVIMVSEKNYQLIYDIKKLQQENEKYKMEMVEILAESTKKDQELQKTLEDFAKIKQQAGKLQEGIKKLTSELKDAKNIIQDKDLQIAQFVSDLDESANNLQELEILKREFTKIKAEKNNLQLEILETNTNRNNMAEILLKNKNLLAENKTLKKEIKNLSSANSDLESKLKLEEESTEDNALVMETAKQEIDELKIVKTQFENELKRVTSLLAEKDEISEQKRLLEEKNHMLKKDVETNDMKIKKVNQSRLDLLNENCELKQRIDDLEMGNFEKLKIIAKLKGSGAPPA